MIVPPVRRRGAPSPPLPPWLAAALLLLAAVLPAGLAAQATADPARELAVHVYTLRHQPVGEALGLVRPLLSQRGSVELREGDNTLVLRDSIDSLERILPLLYAFDHPPRDVQVELWLIRATGGALVSPPTPTNVPVELLHSLKASLPYQEYQLVADSRLRSREGQRITFQLGARYSVRFRLGTIVGNQRLKLNDFEVFQDTDRLAPQRLVKTQLNLWLGRNTVFALSSGESSPSALMVVVRCQPAPAAARRPQ